jgi:hypothetical protein
MEAKHLKADLAMIGAAVDRAEITKETKALFREILAWNEGLVDQTLSPIDERLDSAEAALDELLDGGGDMLSQATAANLIAAFQHGQLLCQASFAMAQGPLSTAIDDLSRKSYVKVIENAQRAFALAQQIVQEIVVEDESDEDDGASEDEDGNGRDRGPGAGDGPDDGSDGDGSAPTTAAAQGKEDEGTDAAG